MSNSLLPNSAINRLSVLNEKKNVIKLTLNFNISVDNVISKETKNDLFNEFNIIADNKDYSFVFYVKRFIENSVTTTTLSIVDNNDNDNQCVLQHIRKDITQSSNTRVGRQGTFIYNISSSSGTFSKFKYVEYIIINDDRIFNFY